MTQAKGNAEAEAVGGCDRVITPSYHYPSFLGLGIVAVRWKMAYEQDPEVLAALKRTPGRLGEGPGAEFWL